jgi:regulatory protein
VEESEDKALVVDLKKRALDLLSRRDHSVHELSEKLRRYAPDVDVDLLGQITTQLIELGYLSEQRYVEMLIRSRSAKGQGPARVRQELQLQRVESELVSLSLEACEIDWFELARQVRERRFGLDDPGDDQKLRAKQQRFLYSRGFSSDQIHYAMQPSED